MKLSVKKPYVIVYSTITIDGRLASRSRYSQLSCPNDLKRLHALRAECDGIMVGANTVIIDDPSLRVKFYPEARNPTRIIVDGRLRTPTTARVYTLKTARTIVLTSSLAPQEKVALLKNLGVEVVVFEGGPTISMREALERLYEMGLESIMVEGGGELLWSLFKDGVVDELRVTVSPYIFGGRDAVSLVMGEGFYTTEDAVKLKLIGMTMCECGSEVHLKYKVQPQL